MNFHQNLLLPYIKPLPAAALLQRSTERLWKFFHRIRNTELPKIWKRCLDNIGLDLDGLVQQFVSQKVFEEIVEALCDSARSESESESDTTNTRNLSCEEEMVIRYASGYVPFKLMKKHE